MSEADPEVKEELKDLDDLLDQEDPSFREDLKQVSEVQPEGELDLDSGIELDDHEDTSSIALTDPSESQDLSRFQRLKLRFKANLKFKVQRFQTSVKNLFFEFLVFLKTRPKEFIFYLLAQVKAVFGFFGAQLRRFSALPKGQKLLVLALVLLSVGVVMLTLKNLKGSWLPNLNPPLIQTLAQVADETYFYNPEKGDAFYKAFPRDADIFLLDKFKVNLKPSEGHPLPMGAFEVVLELDSKEAAIEAQTREVELHDTVQREFEAQTYPDMLTDLGKQKLKNQIKKVVDDHLTQGWVQDVHFQTFVLKP